ncbi:SARP family transcriptional regulator [Acrocarpospora pleiomorpha]|uniref:SARP family transcriptional regulator n=1 Tax=Acrocarpospora pleiomorpha TaxID=90975 RepID=A0A5M3XJ88_9ACTN|nr:BTAD domain-containing putative transcriptional regulator [Acrocarpospora pleiomorpha]GES21030.1 SARP family transcriptional regulator [Acrocarpospora pleiomorpha]
MRIGILGVTRVWRDDGSEVALGGPVRRALLALLSVRAGEAVPLDRLIDDLYGGQAPDGAAHAVQSQVSRLRQALRPDAAIEFVPAGYRLLADPEDVDTRRFERLADEGRQVLGRGDPVRAAELLRAALDLWRGPALADAADAGSVRAEAARLDERRLGALEDRIEAELQRGGHRAAVPELRELAARHPLRERLWGLLLRALRADGRQAEALAAFEEIRTLLADELGADPSPGLAAIHRSLLRGDPVAPALPAQLTTFVGRADDLAGVTGLLARARLVTLLGAGGVGKTRLAIEAASAELEVCLVELARVRDGAEVPAAVLGALGLRESGFHAGQPGVRPESRLVAALEDRAVLLLLDNCEHLVDAVAALTERLLKRCPALRVLATSREPLGITGENLWPVRPLPPVPAERLFADRAAAVRPGFVVDDANAGTVRRICQALDGLPLAIELAAARLRTHEVAELAAGLDDRFRLLSRGSRTAEARHQTLRAVVAWSWDLLPENEREMARRLTVFHGGATAEAARRVCALPGAEDVLDSLAGKSLIEVAGGRYRMLETIRAYCAEQLEEAGEADAVRHAHADHFLRLARTADPHLRGPEQLGWLATLKAEEGNLHAALRWTAESGETGMGLALLASMAWYTWLSGTRAAVTPWATALLDATPPAGLETDYVLGALIAAAGGGPGVWERCRPAVESIIDRPLGHPAISFLWPVINTPMGDPRVVISVIARGRAAPDRWRAAISNVVWGYSQLMMGGFAAAEEAFATAAETFRVLGDRWGAALALDSLAGLAYLRDDPDKAIVLTGEAIARTERLGAMEDVADLLCNRGDYRVHRASAGDLAAARSDYARAAEIARRAGSPTYLAAAMTGFGDIARLGGDLAGARRLYEQALERFETHWLKSGRSRLNTFLGLGKVAEASGAPGEARVWYVRAVETALAGPLPEGARAVEALAGIALAGDDAARLLGAATVLRGSAAGPDPDAAKVVAAARAALGDSPYEAAFQEGARMSLADAFRLAGVPESAIEILAVSRAVSQR